MQALLDAVVDFATLVSPAKARTVASALRGLAHPGGAPSANALADTAAARDAVRRMIAAWSQIHISGDEVAGLLLGASEARSRVERELRVELVLTGPTTRVVPTRRTEQVLLDLIGGATTDVFLVSFVAYDVPSVVAALNDATNRGIRVRILLEASTTHGGSLNIDPAATINASVPAAVTLTWKNTVAPFIGGRVHAKIAVVDGARAFITSANITGHALEKNMEAGVLIHGGTLPRMLLDHFDALVAIGTIAPTAQQLA